MWGRRDLGGISGACAPGAGSAGSFYYTVFSQLTTIRMNLALQGDYLSIERRLIPRGDANRDCWLVHNLTSYERRKERIKDVRAPAREGKSRLPREQAFYVHQLEVVKFRMKDRMRHRIICQSRSDNKTPGGLSAREQMALF